MIFKRIVKFLSYCKIGRYFCRVRHQVDILLSLAFNTFGSREIVRNFCFTFLSSISRLSRKLGQFSWFSNLLWDFLVKIWIFILIFAILNPKFFRVPHYLLRWLHNRFNDNRLIFNLYLRNFISGLFPLSNRRITIYLRFLSLL